MKRPSNAIALSSFVAAVAGSALLGTQFTPAAGRIGEWYSALKKPSFTPPGAAFPIAWTTLYALMAWSAFRVWKTPPSKARTSAISAWAAQLTFNAAWSPIFFGAKQPKLALADLVALLVALLTYTSLARKSDRPAAWMMLPYIGWVVFAGVLNLEIARMND